MTSSSQAIPSQAIPDPEGSRPRSAPGTSWQSTALAVCAATAMLLLWSLFVRSSTVGEPLTVAGLSELGVNPYYFGLAIQEMALPVLLVLIFSRTAIFRRAITDDWVEGDRARLLAWLIGMLILAVVYRLALATVNETWVTFGLFIVFVAGVLGGWTAGALVGAAAALGIGFVEYFVWNSDWPLPWAEFLEYYILKNMAAMVAIWFGAVIGLLGSAQPLRRRYSLPQLTWMTLFVYGVAAFCIYLGLGDASYFFERLLPGLLVPILAVLAFGLMAKDVENDARQRQAEATELALAQTNLTLTQTKLALAEAELRALHAQINPHFFFNALNTIRYFIRTDADAARDLLIQLSEIFQRALSAGEFVPLSGEIAHVEAYLALEQARLEERLRVIWTNLAQDRLDTLVPTLVLQPLVENAVIHGLAPQPTGGTLHIVLNEVGGDLLIQVDDDGIGFDSAKAFSAETPRAAGGAQPTPGSGRSLGIRNVDERLRLLYGPAYGLTIQSTPGKGTRALVRIPLAATAQVNKAPTDVAQVDKAPTDAAQVDKAPTDAAQVDKAPTDAAQVEDA